jgi:long-chain acyl-CoA synthetase
LWQIWGVNVCEIYGQTETAGAIITGQQGPFPRPGDVGTAPPGWHIELGEGNEILVSGGDLFEGYWRDDKATSQAFDSEGRLLTGDVGELREGRLRIVDRARDFIVTAGGKTISPAYIENILRASPYIGEVVVFGHARKYLSALIEIDYDTVSDWARSANISYTGFTSLALHDAVQALIGTEIGRANDQLARVEQIKVFRILPKALDPEEEGEPVTPTRKIKRKLMFQRFETLIESMYDDSEDLRVARELGDLLQS